MDVVWIDKPRRGQGLVEYAMIIALVAVVVVIALSVMGPVIGNVFSELNAGFSL
jgi:pilus assembly protein Flp/PilA